MFISWRPFLVCAALCLLNLAWASSAEIWPPTQVLCKESTRNELGNLKNYMIAVPSISEFDRFIKKTMLWVDKSLLIKAIFEYEQQDINKDIIWVTSSPRWGKTMNLNMFAFYCELYTDDEGAPLDREKSPAYQYFVNGSIVENGKVIDKTYPQPPLISSYKGNKEHLANYPVIRLHGGKLNMETGISSIRMLIHEAYRLQIPLMKRLRHLSTCDGNLGSKNITEKNLNIFEKYYDWNKIMVMVSDELLIGIQTLCDILKSTYDRMVVIVFDDFDHFIHAAYFGDSRFQSTPETSNFLVHLDKFLVATFKDNQYLKKALITGVLSIKEETYLSGLNSTHKSCVFDYDNIYPFYGIFDWELEKMMEFRGLDTKHFDVQSSLEFNGFRSLANLTSRMFSTYSVANFISSANPRVISHQPTGCIGNVLTKMLNRSPKFKVQMLMFVKTVPGTFVRIPYDGFHSLFLEECQLVNKLMHGVETYDWLRHRNMIFSLVLKFGLASVSRNQTRGREMVEIKIPNREAMDYIQSKIFA